MTDPAGFNVGMTDRCGLAGAADLLIGDNGNSIGQPSPAELVQWDRSCKRGSLGMKDWILGMAAAIFRLSRRSIFIQTLPVKSRESTSSLNLTVNADGGFWQQRWGMDQIWKEDALPGACRDFLQRKDFNFRESRLPRS